MIEYPDKPHMYKAMYDKGQLLVTSVSPQIYMKYGTEGLGHTQIEAVVMLKAKLSKEFMETCKAIDWQARCFIGG